MQHTEITFIIILFILFRIYRRIRRVGEFQKIVKWRVFTRITLSTIIGIALLVTGISNPVIYLFDAAGIVLGGIVAYFAIRSSMFELREDAWFYSQNPWIHIFLIVLFIGRVTYKAYQIYVLPSVAQGTFAESVSLVSYSRDPSTTGILFILITYYIVYYTFLLRTNR